MEDFTQLLDRLKAVPFEDHQVLAPHTGVVRFVGPAVGAEVSGASGEWKEIPGTTLAVISREHNEKRLTASRDGQLMDVQSELNGKFVEAGTVLATIRHPLTRDEVIAKVLRHVLSVFKAPERAKYLFTPSVDAKIKSAGHRTVTVQHGMELFIMTRMKRETPVYYLGPTGIIYDVYFTHNENVEAGSPLIGVCPEGQAQAIEELILRIQTSWNVGR